MKDTTKKIAAIVVFLGSIASILGFIILVLPNVAPISKGTSIDILGIDDRYHTDYDEDFNFDFILVNDGEEYVTVKYIFIRQILWDGKNSLYPGYSIDPSEPKIEVGHKVNMSVTIPAHKAVGTTVMQIAITYNDYIHEESKMFDVTRR
ncbi:MAG: hypothetical protein U9R21_02245 [Candidatus Thermoplasmatota archaeon]|nr:hypothetical protein [Candidatus Thermoplasmatota archaeon]